jgi:hypothetical protein
MSSHKEIMLTFCLDLKILEEAYFMSKSLKTFG